MQTAALVAVIAALAGPLLTYLVAARRLSGKIATSDASDLWTESRSIREDYQRRIEELNAVVARCEKRIELLEDRNKALYLENGQLKRMIEEHEATIAELRLHVHRLGDENVALRDENVKLRKRVTELEAGNE